MQTLTGKRRYAPFDNLAGAFFTGEVRLVAAGLAGGSAALVLAELLRKHEGPALVLVKDRRAALAAQADLAFFLRERDGAESDRLLLYPAYDVAPFESISPHPAITAQRMACLEALAAGRAPIVIAPVEAAMQRTLSRAVFNAGRQSVEIPGLADRDELIADLHDIGYRITSIVEEVGEAAYRGGIVDVFPPGRDLPVRIEMFGDDVESIREFDPSTQTTRRQLREVYLFPCSEVFLGEDHAARFTERLKKLAEDQDVPRPRREHLTDQVAHRIQFPGIEFFTPLLHDETATLLDHFDKRSLVTAIEPVEVENAIEAFHDKVTVRYERAREAGKVCVEPNDLYLDPDAFAEALATLRRLDLGRDAPAGAGEPILFETAMHPNLREQILARAGDARMLAPLAERLRDWLAHDGRAVLVCRGLGAADRLERLLQNYDAAVEVRPEQSFRAALSGGQGLTRVPVLLGDLSAGFEIPGLKLAVVTEEEIFGERRRTDAFSKRKVEMVSSFSDLKEDDFIVHLKHGVGIYRGLVQMAFGDVPGEFLHLEYARGDKLYLPVDRLSAVQRFIGAGGTPRIDRLGGTAWEKTKRSARGAARKLAKELLALYAARAEQPGYAFAEPEELYREFEATFPYEETSDQAAAIEDVLRDLQTSRPADRLVCGDVGFGKTEVALRAAFLAVLSGKQVALLVPTTTLCFQHFWTFQKRMQPFGVKVEMLSRFVSPKKRREVIKALAAGEVDVVVGTHQLLGKSVQYNDLGLLLVDEEQHFGVAQKEKIKQLAKTVDVLTFTATPIPRTLHMSLVGIRDLSVINTPPEDRLAIRTYVTRYDEDTIREALERELGRGGQVFFIHNRVKTIDNVAAKVQRLAPHARVAIGHGQMDQKRIEKLMIDFAQHRFDILVSTTIVESGLDFPAANTILIDRADALGLSQLYQLRGRVGRSKLRAYCYLLVPPYGVVNPEARKRLAVLRTFTDLGSGYKIAARDLEIRGAGNLLGAEQSGHIGAVGFELYTRLLDEETKRLKGEDVEEPFECEVALHVPAYLPEDYVADVGMRLSLYKRIADAHDDAELETLTSELHDRFGQPSPPVRNLLRIVSLRRRAEKLRISKVEAGEDRIAYEFDDSTPVSQARLVQLIGSSQNLFSLTPDGKLYEKISALGAEKSIFDALEEGLQRLADCVR